MMKDEKTRVVLTPEQIARCRAKARANNSSVHQEVFLAAGGRLKDWYESGVQRPAMFGFPSDGSEAELCEFAATEVARSRAFSAALEYRAGEPIGGSTEAEDARARVAAVRIALALMARLGRPLKQKEADAVDAAAAYIGMATNESERLTLEASAIERAVEMVNG